MVSAKLRDVTSVKVGCIVASRLHWKRAAIAGKPCSHLWQTSPTLPPESRGACGVSLIVSKRRLDCYGKGTGTFFISEECPPVRMSRRQGSVIGARCCYRVRRRG